MPSIPLIPPKGKHIFGTVSVGERGQIVIPKKAREVFHLNTGDSLLVLGDESQGGIALIKTDLFIRGMEAMMANIGNPLHKEHTGNGDKNEEGT